ncbi:hypothetical protein RR48_03699 [Papilio machaon]|uniref:Synaptic vesicle glycoprotein 2B n=1 Tax=Papilio machaon TaxID=76193 RepID=A0A0N1PIZ7_PAPMA|nr:hypothetical protein RR48_03699 [Papilio machaon]
MTVATAKLSLKAMNAPIEKILEHNTQIALRYRDAPIKEGLVKIVCADTNVTLKLLHSALFSVTAYIARASALETMVCETKETEDQLPFDEALEKTGNGIYNILLAATCALSLLAIGADLFGFSLVVTAACDLHLTVAQKGILTSTPFIGECWCRMIVSAPQKCCFLFCCVHLRKCMADHRMWSTFIIRMPKDDYMIVYLSCAANSVSYTLVGESCVRRVRNKYMVMMTCFILFSPAFAALLTYPILKLDFEAPIQCLGIVFRPWRLLNIILALPSGLGALALYFFHESPKFLANCGRREEALEVMRSIYAVNHSCSKEEFGITSFTMSESAKKEQSLFRAMYEQSAPLFRPPYLWRTLQLYFIVAVVFITVVAAWFLPPDKPLESAEKPTKL